MRTFFRAVRAPALALRNSGPKPARSKQWVNGRGSVRLGERTPDPVYEMHDQPDTRERLRL
jgi:hypothetical protein